MINAGGWLLLSAIFSALWLVVQRSERKRRRVAAVVMLFVAITVWRYALYRITGECIEQNIKYLCDTFVMQQRGYAIAVTTVNLAILTSLLFNMFFWVLIGRSNPPGSSDSIKVYGLDEPI